MVLVVFQKTLSKLKRISKELADQVDDLLINAGSALYEDEALAGLNSERITTDSILRDIKILLHTNVPTMRYVPINVRYKWSKLFSDVITDCVEDPNTELNWRKHFGLSKCILRARNRGGQKQGRNNDQRLLERIKRWNCGEFGGLWNEACSLKQSKQSNDTSSEDIIKQAKNFCFQVQCGRAAKALASDCFAPVNKATLDNLKNLHPTERKLIVVQSFESQDYQFS